MMFYPAPDDDGDYQIMIMMLVAMNMMMPCLLHHDVLAFTATRCKILFKTFTFNALLGVHYFRLGKTKFSVFSKKV